MQYFKLIPLQFHSTKITIIINDLISFMTYWCFAQQIVFEILKLGGEVDLRNEQDGLLLKLVEVEDKSTGTNGGPTMAEMREEEVAIEKERHQLKKKERERWGKPHSIGFPFFGQKQN